MKSVKESSLKSKLKSYKFDDPKRIDYEILNPRKVYVRVYILEGLDIWELDGDRDTYIKIKLGEKEIDDQKGRILETDNPKFYKYFEL